MNTLRIFFISITMIIISGCSVLSPTATPTPTPDQEATAEAVEAEEALGTQNAEATAEAINATAEAEATSVALTEAAATPTILPVSATRTARAEAGFDVVQSLYDGDFISTTEGSYLLVNKYVQNIAKINYFTWRNTDHSPSNFVFHSNLEWQSASDVANWFNSGCGIVFRQDRAGDNFYVVFLNLDGSIELKSWVNGQQRQVATGYYGNLDIPDGEAELLITAEGERIQVFVNSKEVISANDSRHSEGTLALSVISGTNKGFGTRCTFDDITLWELDIEE